MACMFATYRPYDGCFTAFMAVCWQPTGLMRAIAPLLWLYVGNLLALAFRVVCWQPTCLITAVGPLLGLYYEGSWTAFRTPYCGCWTAFRAVCWQPRLMRAVGPVLELYVCNPQAL